MGAGGRGSRPFLRVVLRSPRTCPVRAHGYRARGHIIGKFEKCALVPRRAGCVRARVVPVKRARRAQHIPRRLRRPAVRLFVWEGRTKCSVFFADNIKNKNVSTVTGDGMKRQLSIRNNETDKRARSPNPPRRE